MRSLAVKVALACLAVLAVESVRSGAVVVVSAGRPSGILPRSDLLEFLAARRSQVDRRL